MKNRFLEFEASKDPCKFSQRRENNCAAVILCTSFIYEDAHVNCIEVLVLLTAHVTKQFVTKTTTAHGITMTSAASGFFRVVQHKVAQQRQSGSYREWNCGRPSALTMLNHHQYCLKKRLLTDPKECLAHALTSL